MITRELKGGKLSTIHCCPRRRPGAAPSRQCYPLRMRKAFRPKKACVFITVCIYYCSTYYKAVRVGGGGGGGQVLRETTSRGLCGLVCPSRTSELGGEGYCVKE